MLYKAFLVGAGALALIASANAASLPGADGEKDANPSAGVTNWNGFFIGVNGGYGWTASNSSIDIFLQEGPTTVTSPAASFDRSGWIGGVQACRNFQFDTLVFGIESDIQSTSITGNGTALVSAEKNGKVIASASLYRTANLEWFHTVRGRAGYSFDNAWIYFTAGFALGENQGETSVAANAAGKSSGRTVSASEALPGYVLGGGVEYALTRNWSLKSEYLYVDFGSTSGSFSAPGLAGGVAGGNMAIERNFNIVRAGLSYRFSQDIGLLH